jgi:hypothetical protein
LAPLGALLRCLGAACVVTAIGGAMHDLRLLTIVQGAGPSAAIDGVFRVRMMSQHLGILAGTLAAPTLLASLGVRLAVLAMAVVQAVTSGLALASLRRHGLR